MIIILIFTLVVYAMRNTSVKSAEALLVVVFPSGKVEDVAMTAEAMSPGLSGLHNGFIQPDGKKHMSICRGGIFFLKRLVGLFLDPGAFNRMFGENQQQLLVQTDRLVDFLAIIISGFQFFGGKPAAYPFALQIDIESFGKALILPRIANEAGVVLNGTCDQGAHIFDEGIGRTCSFV